MYPITFSEKLLEVIEEFKNNKGMTESWAKGIMKLIPKETGEIGVDKLRPITLLNVATKWITLTIKIALEDFLQIAIPKEQRGSMKKRKVEDHIFAVLERQRKKETGCWVALDFRKAFDTLNHSFQKNT